MQQLTSSGRQQFVDRAITDRVIGSGRYDRAQQVTSALSRAKTEELLGKQNLIVLYAVPWPPQGSSQRPSMLASWKVRRSTSGTT